MAEIFKLPVDGKQMDFHCGTYAVEKTLDAMGINLSDVGNALDQKFVPTIRHFIYFSAKDAQRLKTEKGQAIDFPYEPDDVYYWLDSWGGGNSSNVAEFTNKLLAALFGSSTEKEQKKSPTKTTKKK
jgi:hypothetical protein